MQLAERRLFDCFTVDVLRHKCFWPFSTDSLNESESGQKHIYARKHQLYCYIKKEVQKVNVSLKQI